MLLTPRDLTDAEEMAWYSRPAAAECIRRLVRGYRELLADHELLRQHNYQHCERIAVQAEMLARCAERRADHA